MYRVDRSVAPTPIHKAKCLCMHPAASVLTHGSPSISHGVCSRAKASPGRLAPSAAHATLPCGYAHASDSPTIDAMSSSSVMSASALALRGPRGGLPAGCDAGGAMRRGAGTSPTRESASFSKPPSSSSSVMSYAAGRLCLPPAR